MEKLKVGLFIDTWYPMIDGVIMVVDNYAKRLAKFCDVTVFTLKPRGKSKKTYPYKIVQCGKMIIPGLDYDLPLPHLDAKFKKSLKQSNLDIVHIHSPFSIGDIGLKKKKKHNIPVVATLHSQFKLDFYRATKNKAITNVLLKRIINNVFNKCDECYAVNERIAEIFVEYGMNHLPPVQKNGTDLEPIQEVENSINLVNQTYNIPDNMPVFLFVGRINKLKNIDFIADSMAKLKTKTNNFKMIFVGDGQDTLYLKNKIKKLKISDNVILTGRISDREMLKALYLRAKLFLFPSMYDASSLVQIEAASQRTPTLFLEGSATSATVKDNINGFICENSTDKYAEKIFEILSNEKLYQKVSDGAFRDLYVSWDNCVQEMYEKYLYQRRNYGRNKCS